MNILKRTLAGLLVVFLAFGQVTSIPGIVDAILGASNITTAGACVYVSASGTLNQDSPGCHWDATNNRLGLGTATPTYTLHVAGNAILNTSEYHDVDGNGGRILWNSSSSNFTIGHVGGAQIYLQRAAISASIGIGPNNTSPTGTLHVYDATPTTGVTTLTVRAGAGNSASNDIFNVWDGTTKFLRVRGDGSVFLDNFGTTSEGVGMNNSGYYLGSSASLLWGSAAQYYTPKDLGLVRDAAGRLRVSNGSTGLGQIMIASSTPASAAATCAAGTVVWDSSYVYVCISANTWKRAAIATW